MSPQQTTIPNLGQTCVWFDSLCWLTGYVYRVPRCAGIEHCNCNRKTQICVSRLQLTVSRLVSRSTPFNYAVGICDSTVHHFCGGLQSNSLEDGGSRPVSVSRGWGHSEPCEPSNGLSVAPAGRPDRVRSAVLPLVNVLNFSAPTITASIRRRSRSTQCNQPLQRPIGVAAPNWVQSDQSPMLRIRQQ